MVISFENVWDEHPKWVNLGAQKNFAQYAGRIGIEWKKSSDGFNEFYFRRAIARALIFKTTEKIVSSQPWYNGGYRANIVAYAIAAVGEICRRRKRTLDYLKIWNAQSLSQTLVNALAVSAKFVHDDIVNPPQGISNISEWCKREACWSRLLSGIEKLELILPDAFWHELISFEEMDSETKAAKKTQKIDNGIDAQKKVFSIPPDQWLKINEELSKKQILSPKEVGILQVACLMPNRIPSEKQSIILLDIYEKAKGEGLLA